MLLTRDFPLGFLGNTPLHIAAGRRLKEIVALLMAYGANPAIANGEGDFPSDLPASLLVRRVKNLVSFSYTVDLNYMNLVNSKSPQNNNIHDYFAVQNCN